MWAVELLDGWKHIKVCERFFKTRKYKTNYAY
jgi:hypothetical protein